MTVQATAATRRFADTHLDRPRRRFSVAGLLVLSLFGLSAFTTAQPEQSTAGDQVTGVTAARAADEAASRSATREPDADTAADEAAEEPEEPEPVAGLDEDQMANAVLIVEVGRDRDLPERAWAVALATAMQESKLYNYANEDVSESLEHDHQAIGSDHDSVGLFQQRPSSGWGSVAELMDPEYAAGAFYRSLDDVSGWESMSVTDAAQTVQRSAYPDAYAKWEDLAWDVIEEAS